MEEKQSCNKCGRPLDDFDLMHNLRLHRVCGYGSKYDLSEIDLTLCCACFDEIIDSCAVSPVVKDVMFSAD